MTATLINLGILALVVGLKIYLQCRRIKKIKEKGKSGTNQF